ncbi:hypothetical protein C1886_15435 [Pseudomonas sp. FW300-N1A1]|uniref:DUF1254 domain-containing protein n=1 Tax=Pseudomonas sp. FW300-N1A1 TaxID=2075555 RepID=UPI000CD01FD8|nr:DUF1254 domain-containing protein [Pseudomonas sp. FW300-N1A1]POA18723.1 hypothetical protein C1886_15435 [Pseudomonas sp. FW300-N1A1]
MNRPARHPLVFALALTGTLAASSVLASQVVAAQAAPPGPVADTKVTEPYVRMMAREAYFWGWPMANIFNRRQAFKDLPEPGLMGGIVPVAPINRLSMLSDYIAPAERLVACPNQDVVYGAGSIALDLEPVVLQVPDFGSRFWVYQVVDLRSDSFAELGKMYGTQPGFYLLVGPDWKGTVPPGITKVFRANTNTGFVIPRVFQDDTAADRQAVQPALSGIDMYPLSRYDGKVKQRDWRQLAKFPSQAQGDAETKWVMPEKFFDELPALLKDAKPLPGEEARYAQLATLAAIAKANPQLRAAMIDEAKKADSEVIDPLLQFRNYGLQLPDHWSTISNGAAFGTDYFSRTAVARSNIFVNQQKETKYFYQDLDQSGVRLNGQHGYSVTFAKGKLPPVKGFWSLTLYNEHHFFAPNDLGRYSIGTKNKSLKTNADGSLTIYVQSTSPGKDKESNWLPAPKDADFSLYIRAYWPEAATLNGQWTPPPVVKTH